MPDLNLNRHKTRTRVSNACRRCRKHKIKCSGSHPCKTCDDRGFDCEYTADERKVAISERTLRKLQRQSNELDLLRRNGVHTRGSVRSDQQSESDVPSLEIQPTSAPVPRPASGSELRLPETTQQTQYDDAETSPDGSNLHHEEANAALSNPLVTEHPGYIADDVGRLRYLGHSSTWSFTQQLLYKVHRNPYFASDAQLTLAHEASIYAVDAPGPILTRGDFTNLPSFEVAMFHVQTVKFRTQPLYYIFHEDDFVFNMNQFYSDMVAFANRSRIWFAHYLVVMAFGKAFNARSNVMTAGVTLFNRAVRLLPDLSTLCFDPVPSTELFLSLALYFQSIDHRIVARLHMGQALRLAQAFGMHTSMQTSLIPGDLATRGRRVWWTIYTLDRRFGASFGASCDIRDEDMASSPPSNADSSPIAIGQDIHVKICRVLGRIINTVYGGQTSSEGLFLTSVQDGLRGAATLVDAVTQFSERCLGEVSKLASHVKLSYHQCIILASRPFLFHLLSRRLESPSPTLAVRLTSAVKGILQVCVDSAVQTTHILNQLKDHDLLDTFLPLDLECAASAALVLVITSVLCPKLVPSTEWLDACLQIFDHMQERGNALAGLRKSETEQLARLRARTGPFTAHHGTATVSDAAVPMPEPEFGDPTAQLTPLETVTTELSQPSLPSLAPFFDEWLMEEGFNEARIMELANALTPQDFAF